MKTLTIRLEEYNMDYEWKIKEEELRRMLIEKFCEHYDINDYFKGESLINNYMIFDQIKDDFLKEVVEDELWKITIKFEEDLAVEIFKLLKANNTLSISEIETILNRTEKYETLILDESNDVFFRLEDLVEFNGYELIEKDETYTLKEAE